jgi:hypothetical protein
MEKSLGQLRFRWNLLRLISAGQAVATFLLILVAIPLSWWMVTGPVFILGCIATILTVLQWKLAWAWLTLLVQSFLFVIGLLSAVFGFASGAYVPILLLALCMVMASEHALTMTLKYSGQFSGRGNRSVIEFNAQALRASLDHVYRRLAWDGVVFGTGFLLSVAIATIGVVGPTAGFLSDPSVYALVASISLALLIMFKED